MIWDKGPASSVCMRLSSCFSTICRIRHFALSGLGSFVGILWPWMHGFVFVFSFLFCWFVCLDYCSFLVVFEVGKCGSSFLKLFLAVLGLLSFHMNFTISFSVSAKKPAGILIECDKSIDKAEEYYYFNNSKSCYMNMGCLCIKFFKTFFLTISINFAPIFIKYISQEFF